MADLLVLGQDPRFGGGAAAQMNAFLACARVLGHDPELLYAAHPALAGKRIALDRVEAVRQLRAARSLKRAARDAESLWAVATTATHAGAAPASGRPYRCWFGTSMEDEWRGRRPGLSRFRRAAFALSLPLLRRLERRVLQGAEAVYATTAASRAAVAAAGDLAEAAVGILPLPVDVDAFPPLLDEEWRAGLERPVLAFVGRADDPRKNVALLFEALPLLQRRIPDIRLRLVGVPPNGPVPFGVETVGRVDSVGPHLRDAALLVLPSRQEGFGIVAAEALAAGVPVLATPSGGPEELLRASGGGRVLAGFQPDELAAAAAELLEDGDSLSAMRTRGRDYVVREHSLARFRTLLASALA